MNEAKTKIKEFAEKTDKNHNIKLITIVIMAHGEGNPGDQGR